MSRPDTSPGWLMFILGPHAEMLRSHSRAREIAGHLPGLACSTVDWFGLSKDFCFSEALLLLLIYIPSGGDCKNIGRAEVWEAQRTQRAERVVLKALQKSRYIVPVEMESGLDG